MVAAVAAAAKHQPAPKRQRQRAVAEASRDADLAMAAAAAEAWRAQHLGEAATLAFDSVAVAAEMEQVAVRSSQMEAEDVRRTCHPAVAAAAVAWQSQHSMAGVKAEEVATCLPFGCQQGRAT